MKQTRDQQRQKLYNAQGAVSAKTIGDGSIRDVERFVAKVLASAVVRRNYPHAPTRLVVKDGRGRRAAGAYGSHAITLPAGWARTDRVVLHEIAHTINSTAGDSERRGKTKHAIEEAGRRGTHYWALDFKAERARIEAPEPRASHGWQFAAIMLDLVKWFIGEEAHATLRASFKKHRVKYTRPREIDAETREKLRARAAANFGNIAAQPIAACVSNGITATHRNASGEIVTGRGSCICGAAAYRSDLDPLGEQIEAWIERTGGGE